MIQSDTDTSRHQQTSRAPESEIGELGFSPKSEEMKRILFRVRDLWNGNLTIFSQTQTLLPAHECYA